MGTVFSSFGWGPRRVIPRCDFVRSRQTGRTIPGSRQCRGSRGRWRCECAASGPSGGVPWSPVLDVLPGYRLWWVSVQVSGPFFNQEACFHIVLLRFFVHNSLLSNRPFANIPSRQVACLLIPPTLSSADKRCQLNRASVHLRHSAQKGPRTRAVRVRTRVPSSGSVSH